MCEALRRLMKDEIEAELNAAVSAAEAKGENKKNLEFAELMIKDGESVAKIQKYTKLTLEKLQELSEKLGVALVM